MHDPQFVIFNIRRPVPKVYRNRPKGRRLSFPIVAVVWHNEPGGRDAGTVCGWNPDHGFTTGNVAWAWRHRRHLSVTVHAYRSFLRWKWQRCEHCGGKSRRGHLVNISHQWDSDRQRWGTSVPGKFHMECSSVRHLTATRGEAYEALYRASISDKDLVKAGMDRTAAWRVIYDVSEWAAKNTPDTVPSGWEATDE